MKTNRDRWIDAALLILDNPDMEKEELIEMVHAQTGVPRDVLEKDIRWQENWVSPDMMDLAQLDDYLNRKD